MYQVQAQFGSMKILLAGALHIQIQAQAQTRELSGGIRTYTKPGTSDTVQVYARCRKKGTTVERAN